MYYYIVRSGPLATPIIYRSSCSKLVSSLQYSVRSTYRLLFTPIIILPHALLRQVCTYVIRTTVYGVNSIEKNPEETKTRHRLLSESNNKKSFLGRYRDEDILTPFTNTTLSEIA